MLHANYTALSSTEPELLPSKVLHFSGIGILTLFAPVTLTLTLCPSNMNLTHNPSKCIRRSKKTFYVKAFESYHITYRQTDTYTAAETITTPLREW